MSDKTLSILFITDIHQNIESVKRIDFSGYDAVLCGGDIINPSRPDIRTAKEIIDLFPKKTYIVPGNCDKNEDLIKYMKDNLDFIHKKTVEIEGIPLMGIGYCRDLKEDMRVYREYFAEDRERVRAFVMNNSKLAFLLDFCGISLEADGGLKILSEEEALTAAEDYINKFVFFDEDDINGLFFEIKDLSGGIILSHSPPYGYLDKLDSLPHIGSHSIKFGMNKTSPRLVLCGHFHEFCEKICVNGTMIVNPGALKDNKYCRIVISADKIDVEFKEI